VANRASYGVEDMTMVLDVRSHVLHRRLAAFAAALFFVTACASAAPELDVATEAAAMAPTEPAAVAPTEPAPMAPTEPAAVAPTEPAAIAPTEAPVSAATVELPNIEVVQISTAATADLAAFAEPGATLLWFWAPH